MLLRCRRAVARREASAIGVGSASATTRVRPRLDVLGRSHAGGTSPEHRRWRALGSGRTRVRFGNTRRRVGGLNCLTTDHAKVAAEHTLSRWSSCTTELRGALAQLGEHLLCKQGVTGSIPVRSIGKSPHMGTFCWRRCLPLASAGAIWKRFGNLASRRRLTRVRACARGRATAGWNSLPSPWPCHQRLPHKHLAARGAWSRAPCGQRQPSSGATSVRMLSMTCALYSTPSWFGTVSRSVSAAAIASSWASCAMSSSGSAA